MQLLSRNRNERVRLFGPTLNEKASEGGRGALCIISNHHLASRPSADLIHHHGLSICIGDYEPVKPVMAWRRIFDRYGRVSSFGRRASNILHEYYDAASRARDHQQRPFLRLWCRCPYFSSTDPPCDFAASEPRALGADSAVGSRHAGGGTFRAVGPKPASIHVAQRVKSRRHIGPQRGRGGSYVLCEATWRSKKLLKSLDRAP